VGVSAKSETLNVNRSVLLQEWGVIRILDLVLVLGASICFAIPMALIAIAIRITSGRPVLYWSLRVGRYNRTFRMPKFRTMAVGAPQVATHLLVNAPEYVTPVGRFLRKLSLDELPQLYSIWTGDMSFVGPRPALYNQNDLIELRTKAGVHRAIPGLTGWAQINGRDELTIPHKVSLDIEYVRRRSLLLNIKILALTVLRVVRGSGVSH